jgi:hypothetical protein
MRIPSSRSLLPASLLGAAALTFAAVLPISASARVDRARHVVARAADRAEERASRAEERAARRQERATRAAERRTARAEERDARRAARKRTASDPPVESNTNSGETATNPPVSGSSPQPDARASRKCPVSIDASSHRITAGETVTLFGKLKCAVTANAADRQVTVYEGQRGGGASLLATATTEADGSYKLTTAALQRNTTFRIHMGNHGAHTTVKVAPQVTLSAPSAAVQLSRLHGHSIASRTRTTFAGTVRPVVAGALLTLQVAYPANSEQWRPVAFGRVGADGSYSIAHGFRMPGQVNIRVVVHPPGLNVPGASEPLDFEVLQGQNPQLTIKSSADPLAFGRSVTISGVAAGAANQPITLLGGTQGSAFAVVAKGTTDENGGYSFTQVPTQNTYYRVSDAAASSTALFQGVEHVLATNVPPSTVAVGAQVTFSGALTPSHDGEVVYLERQNPFGIGFHILAIGTVDAGGTYSVVHTFASVGTYLMRIKVPRERDFVSSTGEPFNLVVTGAPAGT